MAGIITISKGHDASYPWRQIGTRRAGQTAQARGQRRATTCHQQRRVASRRASGPAKGR